MAWVLSWVVAAYKTRPGTGPTGSTSPRWWPCWAALGLGGPERPPEHRPGQVARRSRGYSIPTIIALALRRGDPGLDRAGALDLDPAAGQGVRRPGLAWASTWRSSWGRRRLPDPRRARAAVAGVERRRPGRLSGWSIASGVRLGATYMGFVVLAKVLWLLIPEILAMRPRRLFAIARLSIIESTRKMWAPWVVIVIFLVILAFTHWFLPRRQRPAELGRIFVGTLSLLCMLLLTVMVTVLSPLSLPQDIQAQTIYTVVTKPVRRLELIWGRMIGYMTIVTALVLLFGAGQPGLPEPEHRRRRSPRSRTRPRQIRQTDPDRAEIPRRPGRAAPDPDVGQGAGQGVADLHRLAGATRRSRGSTSARSWSSGATSRAGRPSAAIWHYGVVPDPLRPQDRLLDRPDPGRQPAGARHDRGDRERRDGPRIRGRRARASPEGAERPGGRGGQDRLGDHHDPGRDPASSATSRRSCRTEYDGLIAEAKKAEAEKKPEDADRLRREAAALHSPPIPIEMTFTIYRTTKGRVGDPVYAELEVENPRTEPAQVPRYLPDPRVLHQQAAAPLVVPGRLARVAQRHGPLHEPDAVPRDGRERLLLAGRRRATSARTS